MNYLEILKVLANSSRLHILHLLKNPREHFVHKPQCGVDMVEVGVCLEEIQRVSGLSQSTTSTYMNMMKKVGLVQATRLKKYTYFKRNEEVLTSLSSYLVNDL